MGSVLTQQRDTEVDDAARWPRVRLGDVCEVRAGDSAPQDKALFKDGEFPFVRMSDVGAIHFGKITSSRDKLNHEGVRGLHLFRAGSILFPKSGASTFLNHRVMLGVDSYVVSHLAVISPKTVIEGKYLLFLLYTIDAKDLMQDVSYPALRASEIADLEIPLPPLSVQHEIVARLERELGAVDKLAKKFEELEAAAEAEFKAELKEMFEEIKHRGEMHRRSSASKGRFGEAEPEGRASVCETQRLGDVCVIKTGKKDVRQGNPNGQYPFFTCAKIPTHSDTYSFDCPALLVAGNGDVGYTQKYVGKFEAYQRTYVLSCFSQNVDIDYLHHLMVGCFQSYAQQMIMGNTMPYIKMGVLENFEIPLPPLSVQREVVTRLDAAKAKKEKLAAAARKGRETAALMRKAILKEAFE